MIRHSFKRLIALLLVLTLCLPYLAGPVSAEESNQTGIRSIVESEPDLREADPAEAGLEDAAVQLGERNGPTPEPTEKLPSETAAPETEAELPAEENGAEAAPMLPAVNPAPAHRDGSVPNEGRSAADQQVLTVDGTDFILIGTKQQLQALDFYPEPVLGNANADTLTENGRYDVMGPIWRIRETRRTLLSDWQTADDPAAVLVYPGDTELIGTFADYELYGKNGRIVVPSGVTAPGDGKAINDTEEIDSYTRYHYVGGTLSDYDDSVTGYSYGKYSPRSNFVVFRDIDLEGENWTPLMFYGLMYGVKGSELDVTLETAVRAIRASEDYDDYADLIQPTISNVSVNTALESRYNSEPEDRTVLIPDKYVGVGFFATVTSARPGTDSGFTNIKAEVRNLKLEDVTVTNGYTSIYINETLVNWLTENLGTGVGYLLDGLLRILTGKNGSDFKNSLSDLLTARAQDPTNLATGGFVGRVYGDVLIENCDVETVQIHSDHSYVGGFAGCVGPGELLGTGGLNLSLLGLNLLSANNLLSVGQGIETNVRNVTVTGIPAGFTVEATGANAAGENRVYCAGGFFGRSNSTSAEDCRAVRVQWVKANNTDGRAGGFLGVSEVGSLASMDDAEGTQIKGLIEAGSLLNAVGYLIPNYTKVDVRFINAGYVEAAWAGGFAADFQSGTVDNSAKTAGDRYAVYNIDHVTGTRYGGGFGAKVCSGALADAAGGISILGSLTNVSISVTDLLSLVNAYVPTIRSAGVKSDLTTKYPARPGAASAADTNNGFLVTVTGVGEDATSGAAGGFLGYASGVQVSDSDVTLLRHTEVTPPANLEQENGDSYFGADSAYAVTSTRYAGGFVGFLDVGSAASLGGGLNILGNSIRVSDVLGALNVVVSTVEHSDVYGAPGGFAVKSSCSVEGSAEEGGGLSGRSGGFAGWMRGGHMQDSSSYNFSYIIGQIAAGGYAGEIEPGSLADVLGSTEILDGLVSVSGGLLSIAQDLVPSIRNSVTTCIPCGGAVRANAASDAETRRGMAGGYVGHNCGGQIWGNDDRPWKNENREIDNVTTYVGDQQECAAIRVLSVYGYEYAGGFTGLMDAGSTAGSGNVSLLFDLVKLSGLLDALKVSYPTEENTAVYGPLAQMDVETWNTWVDYVGQFGGYGLSMTHVSSRTELDGILGNYLYGYHVAAGRSAYQNVAGISDSGCAGGYVGSMRSGCITNGQAYNAKQITAMRSAGGYAGEMKTGSVANLGQAEALGLSLDLSQLLTGALDVFVPVVKTSTVHGYQSGLTVAATGEQQNGCGNAGGFAGIARGAQIWGDDSDSDQPNTGCNVFCLKKVQGTRYVGGLHRPAQFGCRGGGRNQRHRRPCAGAFGRGCQKRLGQRIRSAEACWRHGFHRAQGQHHRGRPRLGLHRRTLRQQHSALCGRLCGLHGRRHRR